MATTAVGELSACRAKPNKAAVHFRRATGVFRQRSAYMTKSGPANRPPEFNQAIKI